VIAQWRRILLDRVHGPPDTSDGGWIQTGPMRSYMCLVYDLYWLQLKHKLPKFLVQRLRNLETFQGARYEVLVAATFARAGFDIELLDEGIKDEKHCEFIATHKNTRNAIYVEAKSRHRRGVLHQAGTFDPSTDVKGDVFGLYADAIKQAPHGHPFLIFIDVNVPVALPPDTAAYGSVPVDQIPWANEIDTGLKERWMASSAPTKEIGVFVTSYSSHFEEDPSPVGVFSVFLSPNPATRLPDTRVLDDLAYCFHRYAIIPRQF
jgi:hypothetical protein